jgi:RNA polymerase sigma-70 factor (ECF subfamily)
VRFERRVLTLAWRLLGSAEDAQDASQEVFLRAFRFLNRFDTRRPFEPWIVRMTVNVCRDLGRKRQPNVLLDPEALRSTSDPHADVNLVEQRRILHRALAELPQKERAAVVLRDIEDFSTAEVAEILGSSEATVRSQISTARLKIRKAIKRGSR